MNKAQENMLIVPAKKTNGNLPFQNLEYSGTMPDDNYCGKITNFDVEVISDEVMKIYSRLVLTFEIKIIRGEYAGEFVKFSLIISPYFFYLETEEKRLQKKVADHRRRILSTFRHLGVIVSHSLRAMMFQIPRTIGNIIRFTINNNGEIVAIDKLLKRVKSFDEMLKPEESPFR